MKASASKPPRKPRIGDTRTLAGGRKAVFVRGTDADGRSSEHFRTVDTLGLLLKRGKIDVPAHDAGQRFAEDFQAASLGGAQAINYASAGGGSSSGESSTERTAVARQRVHRALKAVGGMGSVGGRLFWDVLGLGMSVKQCARNQSLNCQEAMGMFMAFLSILSGHYGYEQHAKKMHHVALTASNTQPRLTE